MRGGILVLVVCVGCGGDDKVTPDGGGGGGGGGSGTHDLGSCNVFPASDGSRDDYAYWNLDITSAPVDAMSSQYMTSMGTTKIHPDFGSDPMYGIPYATVSGTQATVPVTFDVPNESDPGPYPFPANAPVEAGSDGHVLIIDRDHCVLYETGQSVYHASTNSWSAYSGAVFDLKTGKPLRPDGWTSADASGGSVFVGLARYEEVAAGSIKHALRFTANTTQQAYTHPATHYASSNTGASVPPMGLRLRLKASACSSLLSGAGTTHPQSKVIVQALCTYGMILADNGSNYYISGATDTRWDDNDLDYLKTIPGSDFEAIQAGTLTTTGS